jgi:hypothetical protein
MTSLKDAFVENTKEFILSDDDCDDVRVKQDDILEMIALYQKGLGSTIDIVAMTYNQAKDLCKAIYRLLPNEVDQNVVSSSGD